MEKSAAIKEWFGPTFLEAYLRHKRSELAHVAALAALPVLIGVASFEEKGNQGVAFVLDLTERKRVEAEARENERRYREAQLELAHRTCGGAANHHFFTQILQELQHQLGPLDLTRILNDLHRAACLQLTLGFRAQR